MRIRTMFYAYRSIALYVKEHSSTETEGAAPKAIFDILIQNAYVDNVFIETTPTPSLSPHKGQLSLYIGNKAGYEARLNT